MRPTWLPVTSTLSAPARTLPGQWTTPSPFEYTLVNRTRSVGSGAAKSRTNEHVQSGVRQWSVRPRRSVVTPRRTAITAAWVGTLIPNIRCRSAPSETACETRSGRRCASARAKWPPRLCPTSATRRPWRWWSSSTLRSTRSSARSEQSTLATNPQPYGRWPIRRSQAASTSSVESPAKKPGIKTTGRPSPWTTPRPSSTGSTDSRASSSAQRDSASGRPHHRSGRVDIAPRRLASRLVRPAAELGRRGLALARALGEPRGPVRPPAAGCDRGGVEPLIRFRSGAADAIARPAVRARRVDQRLDVAAGGQHEAALAAEQLRAPKCVLPRHEVVVEAGDGVDVGGTARQVDRLAEHLDAAGARERVLERDAHEVAVQAGGEADRVLVPVEDVEGRRPAAHQVVVDDVAPDQVVRTQPREDPGERAAVEVALARGLGHGGGREPAASQCARRSRTLGRPSDARRPTGRSRWWRRAPRAPPRRRCRGPSARARDRGCARRSRT